MSRKRGQGKSSKKSKRPKQQVSQQAANLPMTQAPPPSYLNPYAMCQVPGFPQLNSYAPFMPPQQTPNAALQYPSFYPQMGIGMPPEFAFHQPMAPPYHIPQTFGPPFLSQFPQNMFQASQPSSFSHNRKEKNAKRRETSSSSSDSEDCQDETGSNDDESDNSDTPKIIEGSSKNFGAIYKPGYSKPEDVDNDKGQENFKGQEKKSNKTTEKANNRKGSLNKKTMENLRRKAVEFYEKEKQSKMHSKRPANVKGASSKVKEEEFSESSSDDDSPKKPKKTKKA